LSTAASSAFPAGAVSRHGGLVRAGSQGSRRRLASPSPAPPPSAWRLLMLSAALKTAWRALRGAVEVAVPLWMLSPQRRGGMGLSAQHAGISLAFVGAGVLLLRLGAPTRLAQMPRFAPLRAFRVGASSQMALLPALALVAALRGLGDPDGPPGFTGARAAAWLLAVALLAGVCVSSALADGASQTLLQLAVRGIGDGATAVPFLPLLAGLGVAADVAGPLGAGLVFHVANRKGLDAGFVFNVLSFGALSAYTASLVLHVQIIGDFGVGAEESTFLGRAWTVVKGAGGGKGRLPSWHGESKRG